MAKQQNAGGAAKTVETLVRPTVEGMGLRLWDVRFEKEGPDWFLRVLIDRDEPLDTDTCEAVSRAIDPLLDEADPIEMRGASYPPRRSRTPRSGRHPAGAGRRGQRHPDRRRRKLHLPGQNGGLCKAL